MKKKIIEDIELLSPEDAEQEYPVLWETVRTWLPELSIQQIAKIVSITVDVCPYCHENNQSCQCWNDE